MKNFIKKVLFYFGYGIYNIRFEESQEHYLIKLKEQEQEDSFNHSHRWLEEYNFKSIIDIGSNTGQFAKKMRKFFPDAKIYSFEPIPEVYNELLANFEGDLNFKAFNCGIGDIDGQMTFNLNEYSDSSSLLKMTEIHKSSFPHTINEKKVQVLVKRLDDILDANKIETPYLLKLDVQGFEDKVINGGEKITSNSEVIITEVSFYELYENQTLFDGIYKKLKNLGFNYLGNYEQLHSPIDHKVLQADAIFKKQE